MRSSLGLVAVVAAIAFLSGIAVHAVLAAPDSADADPPCPDGDGGGWPAVRRAA